MVGPSDLWEEKRNFQIKFLINAGLKSHHRLLDFGCGTLRGGLPLIEYLDSGNYFGLDVRTETLREASSELIESGLDWKKPTIIHCHDLSSLYFPKRFDYIWAFSVLIHLSDSVLDQVLEFLSKNIAVDGKFYANVNYGDNLDGVWRNFPFVFRSPIFYQQIFLRHQLNVKDLGALHEHGHVARPRPESELNSQRMLVGKLNDGLNNSSSVVDGLTV